MFIMFALDNLHIFLVKNMINIKSIIYPLQYNLSWKDNITCMPQDNKCVHVIIWK